MAANEVVLSLEEKVAYLENAISKKDQILQNMISLYDEQTQEDMYQEEEATRYQPAPLNPR